MFEFTFDEIELEALNSLLMMCFENIDDQLLPRMEGVNPPYPSLLGGDNDSGGGYSELDKHNSD